MVPHDCAEHAAGRVIQQTIDVLRSTAFHNHRRSLSALDHRVNGDDALLDFLKSDLGKSVLRDSGIKYCRGCSYLPGCRDATTSIETYEKIEKVVHAS